jgi:thiol-disulfide isomerase/thioredoxin
VEAMRKDIGKNFTVYFFYNLINQSCVKSKLLINDFIRDNSEKFTVNLIEVNSENNHSLISKFNIKGVPTTLFFKGEKLKETHLGEFSYSDLKNIFSRANKQS